MGYTGPAPLDSIQEISEGLYESQNLLPKCPCSFSGSCITVQLFLLFSPAGVYLPLQVELSPVDLLHEYLTSESLSWGTWLMTAANRSGSRKQTPK
jgi:hypothetical protein